LESLGTALSSGTNAGNIILTMPIVPGAVPDSLYAPCSGPLPHSDADSEGLAWLTGYDPEDYAAAISDLASTKGWLFVDQSEIDSLNIPAFFLDDGIHPSPLGAQLIANYYIDTLGL
jgi:hypothetical protein